MALINLLKPDTVRIITETEEQEVVCQEDCLSAAGVTVTLKGSGSDIVDVNIEASGVDLCHLVLHWNCGVEAGSRILGDAWERGYGDLEFLEENPERFLPWYFLAVYPENQVYTLGVMVRPAAFCYWKAEQKGITLWLDLRNGGLGTRLPEGKLKAATLVQKLYKNKTPFAAACEFCSLLCLDPIFPSAPIYGSNNWYYTYGNSSQEEVLQNVQELADLTAGNTNRPYMVLDDGWQPSREDPNTPSVTGYVGGPWDRGNQRFPDMAKLAEEMKAHGVIPGIWIRLLSDESKDIPKEWRCPKDGKYLDPTVPEVAAKIGGDVRRLVDWGYRLIKHDFSTCDLFGLYGWQMNPLVTEGKWHFHDHTRTNAQIVMDLYRLIRESAGNALILGCDCVGHLGAGLMELNRTGDDVSGREWERTWKMGVNSLAFRMPQHENFFVADADCIGITDKIPWELNRRWLHLLSHSGTPLFYSMAPNALGPEAQEELRKALALASQAVGRAEPLDWMETRTPRKWRYGNEVNSYCWEDE